MILFASWICRICIVIAAGLAMWALDRKKAKKKDAAFAIAALLLAAVVGQIVASQIPPLKDEITITALGQKSETALADEVAITGFNVDGTSYPVGDVVEGKWFWRGVQYIWRNESDSRQPEGTTRTIVMKVPVGWERYVELWSDEYRGLMEVVSGGNAQTIDTGKTSSARLERSETGMLILNQALQIACFGLIFLGVAALLWLCKKRYLATELSENVLFDHKFHVALGCISLFALLIMLNFAPNDSFWMDELAAVGYVTRTDSILDCMGYDIAWPPLWKGIMFIWYRMVPWGEEWLLILSELCGAVGIFFVGLFGKTLYGRRAGLVAALLTAINTHLYRYAFFEITSYACLFMLSAMVLYLYSKRLCSEKPYSVRQMIPLLIAMTLACYTHYFGFFLCGVCFLIDVVLFMNRKIPLRYIVLYAVLAIAYLPWLIFVFATTKNLLHSTGWQPKPTVDSLIHFLKFLCGYQRVTMACASLGAVLACMGIIRKRSRKQEQSGFETDMRLILPVLTSAILFISVFLYGKYIAAANTFWVDRYFQCITPCLMALGGYGVISIWKAVESCDFRITTIVESVIVLILIQTAYSSVTQIHAESLIPKMAYEQEADYFYVNADELYDPDMLCIFGDYENNYNALMEYYVTREGDRDWLPIVWYRDVAEDELLNYRDIIYIHSADTGDPFQSQLEQLLSESYEQTGAEYEIGILHYSKTE